GNAQGARITTIDNTGSTNITNEGTITTLNNNAGNNSVIGNLGNAGSITTLKNESSIVALTNTGTIGDANNANNKLDNQGSIGSLGNSGTIYYVDTSANNTGAITTRLQNQTQAGAAKATINGDINLQSVAGADVVAINDNANIAGTLSNKANSSAQIANRNGATLTTLANESNATIKDLQNTGANSNIATFTNQTAGSVDSLTNQNGAKIDTFTNEGEITAMVNDNATIDRLTNTGTIKDLQNNATITTIENNGGEATIRTFAGSSVATLTNNANATLNLNANGGKITTLTNSGTATLANAGTIESLTNTGNTANAKLTNGGIITNLTLQGGTLALDSTNTGTITTLENQTGSSIAGFTNANTIETFSNAGKVDSLTNTGSINKFTNSSTIATLTNANTIKEFTNSNTITTLNNSGNITGFSNTGTITNLENSGLITTFTNTAGHDASINTRDNGIFSGFTNEGNANISSSTNLDIQDGFRNAGTINAQVLSIVDSANLPFDNTGGTITLGNNGVLNITRTPNGLTNIINAIGGDTANPTNLNNLAHINGTIQGNNNATNTSINLKGWALQLSLSEDEYNNTGASAGSNYGITDANSQALKEHIILGNGVNVENVTAENKAITIYLTREAQAIGERYYYKNVILQNDGQGNFSETTHNVASTTTNNATANNATIANGAVSNSLSFASINTRQGTITVNSTLDPGRDEAYFVLGVEADDSPGIALSKGAVLSSMRRSVMIDNILDSLSRKMFHSKYDASKATAAKVRQDRVILTRVEKKNKNSKILKDIKDSNNADSKNTESQANSENASANNADDASISQSEEILLTSKDLDSIKDESDYTYTSKVKKLKDTISMKYTNQDLLSELNLIFVPYIEPKSYDSFILPYAVHDSTNLGAGSSSTELGMGALLGAHKNLKRLGSVGVYAGYEYSNINIGRNDGSAKVGNQSFMAGAQYYNTLLAKGYTELYVKTILKGELETPNMSYSMTDLGTAKARPNVLSAGAEFRIGANMYNIYKNSYISPELGLGYTFMSIDSFSLDYGALAAIETYTRSNFHLPALSAQIRYEKAVNNKWRYTLLAGARYNLIQRHLITLRLGTFSDSAHLVVPSFYVYSEASAHYKIKENQEFNFSYNGFYHPQGIATALSMKWVVWF
ncbi:hypothetical protein CQA49_08845, partial [Helicobacter sp. MIT 00-7814]|uniref:autotransporter outer membrane beta-barrel domain-containing protein n=1 Tax=unclassified Helicobacter TaxID=2593540 RepID=UPI000E38CD4C